MQPVCFLSFLCIAKSGTLQKWDFENDSLSFFGVSLPIKRILNDWFVSIFYHFLKLESYTTRVLAKCTIIAHFDVVGTHTFSVDCFSVPFSCWFFLQSYLGVHFESISIAYFQHMNTTTNQTTTAQCKKKERRNICYLFWKWHI